MGKKKKLKEGEEGRKRKSQKRQEYRLHKKLLRRGGAVAHAIKKEND